MHSKAKNRTFPAVKNQKNAIAITKFLSQAVAASSEGKHIVLGGQEALAPNCSATIA